MAFFVDFLRTSHRPASSAGAFGAVGVRAAALVGMVEARELPEGHPHLADVLVAPKGAPKKGAVWDIHGEIHGPWMDDDLPEVS